LLSIQHKNVDNQFHTAYCYLKYSLNQVIINGSFFLTENDWLHARSWMMTSVTKYCSNY